MITTDSKVSSGVAAVTDLADFFSAAQARTDRWRQLTAVPRAWQTSSAQDKQEHTRYAEAVALFGDVAVLEAFYAYPGPRVMTAIEQALAERNAGVCTRLVQHVSTALLTEAYR